MIITAVEAFPFRPFSFKTDGCFGRVSELLETLTKTKSNPQSSHPRNASKEIKFVKPFKTLGANNHGSSLPSGADAVPVGDPGIICSVTNATGMLSVNRFFIAHGYELVSICPLAMRLKGSLIVDSFSLLAGLLDSSNTSTLPLGPHGRAGPKLQPMCRVVRHAVAQDHSGASVQHAARLGHQGVRIRWGGIAEEDAHSP